MLVPSSSFLSLSLGAASVLAFPLEKKAPSPLSASLTHKIHEVSSFTDVINSDRAKFESRAIRVSSSSSSDAESESRLAKRQGSEALLNVAASYEISVGVGGNSYDLILDTGSGITWLGSYGFYTHTDSTVQTDLVFNLTYGDGSYAYGPIYNDTVSIGGVDIANQGVGDCSNGGDESPSGGSVGFAWREGILGLGPSDLTWYDFTDGNHTLLTPLETAYAEGVIPEQVLGIYLAPTSNASNWGDPDVYGDENGSITFGGIDTSLTTSDVTYVPMTTSSRNASLFWGIDMTSLTGNGTTFGSDSIAGIVDSGTTLIYLPTDWFSAYQSAITNATLDSTSGLLSFPKSSLDSVPDLTFTFGGGATFTLNKYAQMIEQGLYSKFTNAHGDAVLDSDLYYVWVGDVGHNPGTGNFDFVIGQKFLERFYSVYDLTNRQVGFAETANTNPTSVPQ